MTTEEIFKIIEQKYKAEEEVKKIISRLTEVANSLKPNILDNCDYESAKTHADSNKHESLQTRICLRSTTRSGHFVPGLQSA